MTEADTQAPTQLPADPAPQVETVPEAADPEPAAEVPQSAGPEPAAEVPEVEPDPPAEVPQFEPDPPVQEPVNQVQPPWAARWKEASEDFATDRVVIARAEQTASAADQRVQQLATELNAAKEDATGAHIEFRASVDAAEAKAETLEALLREFRDLR